MGKRDRFKRLVGGLSYHSKKSSASESVPNTSSKVLKSGLKEPADNASSASLTGRQSQDAPTRDLWRLALDKLSSEEKKAIVPLMLDSHLEILQRLHTAAVDRRTECEDKRWKFELNGRQIFLRDVAQKIIVWIDKFKQIGDIAVNCDPVHASLPWAGIRFLLEIAVADSQQMGALLTGVEKIASLIGRCQIYETLYLKREESVEDKWKEAVKNLKSALVALYATMLSFLGSTIRAYAQGAISRTLRAILTPAEAIGFLDKCQTLEKNVAYDVDNCERLHSRLFQASSEEDIQELKEILDDLQTPVLRTDSNVALLCEKLDSFERQTILDWISTIPYEEHHFFASTKRTEGTGRWLLRHPQYQEWRASSASMILWIHGDPGAGKTKLVSTVVDDFLEKFKRHPNDEAFAYFYCDRNQSDRQDPTFILSSFVRQLSISRDNNVAIPRSTVQVYHQKGQTGFISGKLKSKESQTILAELFQIYPQVTLVVDALDECDKMARLEFMDILDKLISESSKPVKVLISSRRDRDIKRRFEKDPNLEVTAIDNRDDIAMFVGYETNLRENFWEVELSSDLKALICDTLVERSGGMFQWVALQIDMLRGLCCEEDIRKGLGTLPRSLKTAYDELYDKIQSQEKSAPIIANRAFQWVMCSCWPLSPTELVAAVRQDPDMDENNEVNININTVLGACRNLLVVDQELNVCRFSHLSVQEYFETHHWSFCKTDCLVAKVCLSLLINKSTTSKQSTQPLKKDSGGKSAYDVLEYACLNWVTHVQRIEERAIVDNRLTALLKRFLGSMDQSSLAYQDWHQSVENYLYNVTSIHFDSDRKLPLRQVFERLSPCSRASLAVVTFGFHMTLLDWWASGFANINQENSSGESLLQLSAIRGSVPIAEDLLKKGADINASGGEFGSALQAASYFGHESIVTLLLDKGADANATGGKYGSALLAASYSGHESILQLLLEKGADVNPAGGYYVITTRGYYGSPLHAASFSGVKSVVQLLLENGADVNASGGSFGSVLQATSFYGHESIVQLLLEKGAEINASDGSYGSALQSASVPGHKSVVQLLLDKGADVNASGGKYGSALETASFFGHKSIVQLLLDKGAKINAPGGQYGSALQSASYSGHESIVHLLLDKGGDVHATSGMYGSALESASYFGHKQVVQQLLNKGADVNATGRKHAPYGNALQAASSRGHDAVVQLLKGAMIPQ